MAERLIRDASAADIAAIGVVAAAAGQTEEWSGSDPAYVRHLLAHGHVVVAEHDDSVAGFGATRRIGAGLPAAQQRPAGEISETREATMLCDLFVDPRAHGLGLGRAMLSALWRPGTPRMTFSSLHAHALPLYTRAGLDAWWPLLYLAGDVRARRLPADWSADTATAANVAELERAWTGLDRSADLHAWAARPAGRPVILARNGEPMAAGVIAGAGTEYGVTHLASAPHLSDDEARDAVLAAVAALTAASAQGRVCLPAPHPAVRPLLAAGWRVEYTDIFMATDPTLLDPRRAVPSPALA